MSGLFGGGGAQQTPPATSSYGGNPAQYIPTAQPQQDTQLQTLINSMFGTGLGGLGAVNNATGGAGPAGWAYPLGQNIAYSTTNPSTSQIVGQDPYAQQALNASIYQQQNVAPTLSSYASGLLPAGSGLLNAGQQQIGLAPQIAEAGFDPQNTLYQSELNKTQQGASAANAASGVAGPYAASTINDAVGNFQSNWDNQQLARMVQGIQGAGSALSTGGAAETLGGNLISAAGPLEQQALSMAQGPAAYYQQLLNAFNQQGQAGLSALSGATNLGNTAFNLAQVPAGDIQSYLGLAQGAPGAAANLGNLGFNQNQAQLGDLGSLLNTGLGGGSIGNALYGSQGLSGALGLPQGSGLLGGLSSLFGGGAGGGGSIAGLTSADTSLFGGGPGALATSLLGVGF
jgi:hypothetical protein